MLGLNATQVLQQMLSVLLMLGPGCVNTGVQHVGRLAFGARETVAGSDTAKLAALRACSRPLAHESVTLSRPLPAAAVKVVSTAFALVGCTLRPQVRRSGLEVLKANQEIGAPAVLLSFPCITCVCLGKLKVCGVC